METKEITDTKEILEIIIHSNGSCHPLTFKINCSDCPLTTFCKTAEFDGRLDWKKQAYEEAVRRYVNAYGKEALVEELI